MQKLGEIRLKVILYTAKIPKKNHNGLHRMILIFEVHLEQMVTIGIYKVAISCFVMPHNHVRIWAMKN